MSQRDPVATHSERGSHRFDITVARKDGNGSGEYVVDDASRLRALSRAKRMFIEDCIAAAAFDVPQEDDLDALVTLERPR